MAARAVTAATRICGEMSSSCSSATPMACFCPAAFFSRLCVCRQGPSVVRAQARQSCAHRHVCCTGTSVRVRQHARLLPHPGACWPVALHVCWRTLGARLPAHSGALWCTLAHSGVHSGPLWSTLVVRRQAACCIVCQHVCQHLQHLHAPTTNMHAHAPSPTSIAY